jgi:hypothetical protein
MSAPPDLLAAPFDATNITAPGTYLPSAAPHSNASSDHTGAWGTQPLKPPFDLWLIQVILVLVIARVLAFLLKKINQPSVIAEVIAGILLGPSAVRFQKSIPGRQNPKAEKTKTKPENRLSARFLVSRQPLSNPAV